MNLLNFVMKGIEYSLICKVYLEGDIAVKHPIIGLIFPEKLEFDESLTLDYK